jgi:fucose permease
MAADRDRLSVAAAYCAFVLVGVSAGVGGVLLPAQMADYGVDRTKIGITFFVFSAGFMLAGSTVGALIHRIGARLSLTLGAGLFAASAFYLATRPPFAGLIAVQLVQGLGVGILESALNAHLTQLPRASQRVNRLHAFFGVGALVGPALAAWMLRYWAWTRVWLVVGLVIVPLLIAFVRVFTELPAVEPHADEAGDGGGAHQGLFSATVRDRTVLLGALFLAIYVGLEISVGNWGFSFLTDYRGLGHLAAGYAVSGYWFGLTAGRFVIAPTAARLGLDEIGMTFACLVGILAATGLIGVASAPLPAGIGLVLLGFFLGPVFPTTMAITPRLTRPRLVATAIGLINGVSVIGGSALPWLAGTVAQAAGMGTLVPFCLVLGALLVLAWWRLARRIPVAREVGSGAASAVAVG